MDAKQAFTKVMQESVNMALATSVEAQPNVRIVTFAYNPGREGRVVFTTFKGNRKIWEFEQNPQVACMPLPQEAEADVQVRIFGHVQKSSVTLAEVVAAIGEKYPGGAETIQGGGDMMEIYEVCFSKAYVTIGMEEAQEVAFA